MLQLKISHAATKSQHSQINKELQEDLEIIYFFKKRTEFYPFSSEVFLRLCKCDLENTRVKQDEFLWIRVGNVVELCIS